MKENIFTSFFNALNSFKEGNKFNIYNFIEYILPPIIIFFIGFFDLCFLGLNSSEFKVNPLSNFFTKKELIGFFIAFAGVIGWLMHLIEFYRIFPNFNKKKIAFRIKLAKTLNYSGKCEKDFGKFAFKEIWNLIKKNDEHKRKILTIQVSWVLLMHVSIGIYLIIVLLLVYLFKNIFIDLNQKNIFKTSILISINVIITFIIYFAAERKRRELNVEIIKITTSNKEKIIQETNSYLKEVISND